MSHSAMRGKGSDRSHLLELPNEILFHLCSVLDNITDLYALSVTCRKLHIITEDAGVALPPFGSLDFSTFRVGEVKRWRKIILVTCAEELSLWAMHRADTQNNPCGDAEQCLRDPHECFRRIMLVETLRDGKLEVLAQYVIKLTLQELR